MRILLINKFHYQRDGGTRAYFNTAKVLNAHGHDTAFFAMSHPENKPSRWSKYFVDNVDYNNLRFLREKISAALNIFYNFQAKRRITGLIKEFKPDIAHLHVIYHQLSPSIIHSLKKYNIPMIMTLHDYKQISPNYSLLLKDKIWEETKQKKYYKAICDRAIKDSYIKSAVCAFEAYLHDWLRIYGQIASFVSPSKFLIDKYREFGFKYQLTKLPNALLNMNVTKRNERKNIMYLGRLSQEKGVDDLIRAYARVSTNKKLYIVGDGPERKSLEKLAEEKIVDNKIIFTGHKRGGALNRLFNQAEIIVLPSKWYENAPYSVIEAQAGGKIILASRIGGIPEQVINGQTGFLFKPGDVDDLEKVIKKVVSLSNKEKEKIYASALAKVRAENSSEIYYAKLMNIYEQAIKNN